MRASGATSSAVSKSYRSQATTRCAVKSATKKRCSFDCVSQTSKLVLITTKTTALTLIIGGRNDMGTTPVSLD